MRVRESTEDFFSDWFLYSFAGMLVTFFVADALSYEVLVFYSAIVTLVFFLLTCFTILL